MLLSLQVYRQTLRIRNISTTGTRIHIIPPTTPFFKVGVMGKTYQQVMCGCAGSKRSEQHVLPEIQWSHAQGPCAGSHGNG